MILLLTLIIVIVYTLFLYPLLFIFFVAKRDETEEFPPTELGTVPSVDLFIAAKNEESCIEAKLRNTLDLEYPKEKLHIHLLANGCTDRTVEIATTFAGDGILIVEDEDVGKTEAQNRAVASSTAEIVVFSDANTLYDNDALLHLVAPFVDESVGVVSGRHFYESGTNAADNTEGVFWNKFETLMKRAESDSGGMIGANGSIYAVRRSLYIPLPEDVISDFMEPVLIAEQGFRTVYAEKAIARERAEANLADELERKKRIVRRSFTSLVRYPQLLNPSRSGRLAWLLWSKKMLRWFAPPMALFAIILATLRIVLGRSKSLDWMLFLGASLFGFAAMLGGGLGSTKSIKGLSHAYYFTLLANASITGLYKGIREGSQQTWDTAR